MEDSQTEFASEIYHLTEEKNALKVKYYENAKALSHSKTALSELGAKHAELQVKLFCNNLRIKKFRFNGMPKNL